MRTIKLIGLTALAALTAMALVDASSAMAGNTALCKVDQVPCEVANQIPHVHEETLTRAQGSLLSDPNVECIVLFLGDTFKAVSLPEGKHHHVVATLANPLHILGTFTYTSCTNSCKVEEINGPADIIVLRAVHELADLTFNLQLKITCFFGFSKCVYNGIFLGHGLGPLLASETNGETRLEEQAPEKVSGSCPEVAKLDLLTTPLERTYIST